MVEVVKIPKKQLERIYEMMNSVADGKGDLFRTPDKKIKYISKEEQAEMDKVILEGISIRLDEAL